jgi:D-alanyl-D-alanine carboxypeptidase
MFASLGMTLAVLLAHFSGDLAAASALKTRAQLAADSAALAAVAESGPYGGAQPEAQAARFARANGGRLLECECDAGAIEMEVTVAIGDVAARARALLDVELLAPALFSGAAQNLHPALARAVDHLIEAADGAVTVTSGYRSSARQAQLYGAALEKWESPEIADNWVAPPGRSMHERGLAVDLGGDLALATGLIASLDLPLYRPLPNEPWHFELVPGAQ